MKRWTNSKYTNILSTHPDPAAHSGRDAPRCRCSGPYTAIFSPRRYTLHNSYNARCLLVSMSMWPCWPMKSTFFFPSDTLPEKEASGVIWSPMSTSITNIMMDTHSRAVNCSIRCTDHYTISTGHHGHHVQRGPEGWPRHLEIINP